MADLKVFTKELLQGVKDGERFDGVILMQTYAEKLTRNGKPYIDGTLQADVTVQFKAWSTSSAFAKLSAENYKNVVIYAQGTVQTYQGMNSVILEDVTAVEGYAPAGFKKVRYDAESYFNALVGVLTKETSETCVGIFNKIMSGDTKERFKEEFAASGHHDNCLSGVLAHTYKVSMFGKLVTQLYPVLFSEKNDAGEFVISQKKKDIFFLGMALHDIGKIDEMLMGVYQPKSKVTHRILGLEYVYKFEQDIVTAYGKDMFYDLVSVVVQHHDTYDDKARTSLAYLVFMADLIESRCMGLAQAVEDSSFVGDAGSQVSFDGRYLTV